MKAWIPVVAALTFSGVMLLAVWLEEPAPIVLPELAPAPPPPRPPAPLVRAIAPPPRVEPPPLPVAPPPATTPAPVATAEEVAKAIDPDIAAPAVDLEGRRGSNSAQRLRKAGRMGEILQRRQDKLTESLETARASGDVRTEQKVLKELERGAERLKALEAQRERLKTRLASPPLE